MPILPQGIIQSAFLWGYMATQLVGGTLADRYGGKRVLAGGMAWFSLASLLLPCVLSPGLTPAIMTAGLTVPVVLVSRFLVVSGGAVLGNAAVQCSAKGYCVMLVTVPWCCTAGWCGSGCKAEGVVAQMEGKAGSFHVASRWMGLNAACKADCRSGVPVRAPLRRSARASPLECAWWCHRMWGAPELLQSARPLAHATPTIPRAWARAWRYPP